MKQRTICLMGITLFMLAHSAQAFPWKKALGVAFVCAAAAAEAKQTYYCTYEGMWTNGSLVMRCLGDLVETNGITHCNAYRLIANSTTGRLLMSCMEVSGLDDTCFNTNMIVYRLTDSRQEKIPLCKLQEGDTILDATGNPTRVIGFLHQLDNVEASTIRFYGQRQGQEVLLLEATPAHLLFDIDKHARFARTFEVGDHFLGVRGKPVVITRIETATASALSAPLTDSGTLLIGAGSSSIGASCYAHVPSHSAAHLYYQVKRGICRLIRQPPTSNGNVPAGERLLLHCLQHIGWASP